MPFFLSKRRLAAKARSARRKLLRESAAAAPVESNPQTQQRTQHDLDMFVEDESGGIKPAGQGEHAMLEKDEIKVEVELLDSKDLSMDAEQLDPIEQDPCREKEADQQKIRCQFCLKQFREASKRVAIAKSKIEFVLGLSGWGTPGTRTTCCNNCRKMFELFYEFKRSCLMVLERSVEIIAWVGANEKDEKFSDSKPQKKAKLMESQPSINETKNVPQTEEFDGLEEGSTSQNETDEEPTIPETSIDLPSIGPDLDFPAHKPDQLTTASERSTELLISDDDSDIPAPPEPDPSHVETGIEKQEKKCGRCRKRFSTYTTYMHHKPSCIKSHPRPEPSILCSQCPRKFHTQKDLTIHMHKHNGARTIPCRREGCTKMFLKPLYRQRHEKICGQSAQFICSVCGTQFRSDTGLRSHLVSHEDPKLSCDLCGKGFHHKDNLKKHAATHSDERNFQCKVCGKRFKSAEANRVHQRIHTQEKPYACHICDQRFRYNCLLKTHLEKGH